MCHVSEYISVYYITKYVNWFHGHRNELDNHNDAVRLPLKITMNILLQQKAYMK